MAVSQLALCTAARRHYEDEVHKVWNIVLEEMVCDKEAAQRE